MIKAQLSNALLANSLPLSHVILTGGPPRSRLAFVGAAPILAPVMDRSASSHTHSRVN